MNYFRCTVGGGKGNTVTVTCAEEFAGLTITLSKTGKTYTKTCPSTSPYVVTFYGVENGTYTVSATYGGRTYSESVVVKNIDCVLNYGFGWVTWVNTAQYLDASDYASLDEVLEDEAAIRELFLEHACVDYMAEAPASNIALQTIINNDLCAKWINLSDYALDFLHANEVIADLMDDADKYGYGEWALMPQVPKMTSNSAPYGTVIYSSEYDQSNYQAWKAFDNDDTTRWASTEAGRNNCYIGYGFPNATRITKVKIYPYGGTSSTDCRIKNFKIQASNDNSTWTDLYTDIWDDFTASSQEFSFTNNNSYLYYRLFIVDNYNTENKASIIYTLQFYAWAPKGNVPVMTANTAPYGTCVKDSEYTSTGRYAWCAFDDNESTFWAKGTNGNNAYIGYTFVNPINVRKVKVRALGSSSQPFVAKVQYSDNNSTWTDTGASLTVADTNVHYISVDDCGYHLYWRIYWTGTNVVFSTYTLQFYGRELKVSVPVMTSNTAPFGECNGNFDDVAYKAFDGATTTQGTATITTQPKYLGYTFPSKVCVKAVQISAINNRTTYKPWHMQLKGSDDNYSTETLIDSLVGSNNVVSELLMVNNSNSYKGFRLYIQDAYNGTSTSEASSNYCNLDCLQFYGLDYSEKEFESGTTKKWLYDHGVELVDMTTQATNSATVTKEADYVELYLTGTNTISQFYATNKIDVTPYSFFRGKIGNRCDNVTARPVISISPNVRTYSDSATTSATVIEASNIPNHWAVNISNVNGEQYCTTLQRNQTQANTQTYRFVEMWLE